MPSRSRLAFLVVLVAILAALTLLRFTWPANSPSEPALVPDLPTGVKEVDADRPPVDSLPAASGRIAVTAESLAHRTSTNQPDAAGLRGGVHLTGSVTAPGAAVSGRDPEIQLSNSSGLHHSVRIMNGRYDFLGLQPGEYVLRCSIRGFNAFDRRIALRAEESTREEDVVLEPAWIITVHVVTPDGEDLGVAVQKKGGPSVLLYSILSTVQHPRSPLPPLTDIDRSFEGVSRNESRWGKGGAREDRVQIYVEPPIYMSVVIDDQVLVTQRVEDRIKEMTFTIDPERVVDSLSGLLVRIRDGESGEAATNASVSLALPTATARMATSSERGVKPDSEGLVQFRDRIPGTYELRASMKGRAAEQRSVKLEPGQTTDLGTITLTTGTRIEGRCVDADGTPRRVAAGLILLRGSGTADVEMSSWGHALDMDAQGQFAVSNLPSDRYVVRIPDWISVRDKKGYDENWTCPPVLVDLRDGPVKNLVLVVHCPVQVVLRPNPGEADGTRFRIITADRLPCVDGGFQGSASEQVQLSPGAYLLCLRRIGETVRDIPFTVGTSRVTIDVSR